MRRLVIVLIALRVGAALVLGLGPATDSPAELDGWDGARFHAIATEPGRPWLDHPVEYPPGTVLIAEVLARGTGAGGVVDTNRRLVFASLGVDLALAGLLAARVGNRPAVAYLVLGTAMIPMGLLRLDLWATLAATVGVIELAGLRRDGPAGSATADREPSVGARHAVGFALAVTVGWLIKIFPALLIPAAIAIRSWRAAIAATVTSLVAGIAWVAYGGIDAIEQVVSLRGATGWHLESVPGSIVSLASGGPPRLEADAYRIGTLDPTIVLAGRIGFLVVAGHAGLVGEPMRSGSPGRGGGAHDARRPRGAGRHGPAAVPAVPPLARTVRRTARPGAGRPVPGRGGPDRRCDGPHLDGPGAVRPTRSRSPAGRLAPPRTRPRAGGGDAQLRSDASEAGSPASRTGAGAG